MSTPAVTQALRVPGRLCHSPTDLSKAYPHDGTAMGLVRDVVARRREINKRPIRGAEFGGVPVDVVRGGIVWSLAFAIRGDDDDAMAAVFPDTFTGATLSRTGLRDPVSTRAGALYSADALTILFSPINTNHPGVIVYSAIPSEVDEVTFAFGARQELLQRVGFLGVPRASDGKIAELVQLADMTAPV